MELTRKYRYWLPDENGNKTERETFSNAVVIIGANGSGKSHLGAWMEQQDLTGVHRIGAQRTLNFNDNIPLKSYSQAEDLVLYNNDQYENRNKKIYKYGQPSDGMYTLTQIDDFDNVLAALIAKKNNETNDYMDACRKAEKTNSPYPHTPETVMDKLFAVWDDIFQQRQLLLEDSKFRAVYKASDTYEAKYSATKMSDGERTVLYFAAQVLCVPENKTLIIDEPELHLHKSLMNRLWTKLEEYRNDCLFIYITHDTQFASMHSQADKIWVKEFDGNKRWTYHKVENSELPEELLLDLLGNRKPVLFVEGEKDSYDTMLYSVIYKDYYIVPCGSCTQVILMTKAFNNNEMLHHIKAYGIIDRDYRSDYEIKKYEDFGIYTLEVAEVENLFIVEELVKAMAKHMGMNQDEAYEKVYNHVIKEYSEQFQRQICKAVVAQIKYKLSEVYIPSKDDDSIKSTLDNLVINLQYDLLKKGIEAKFEKAKNSLDYKEIIKIYNEKGLSKEIGKYIDGINPVQYCQTVINLVKAGNQDIVEAIVKYLPDTDKIPR